MWPLLSQILYLQLGILLEDFLFWKHSLLYVLENDADLSAVSPDRADSLLYH